jgi:uncharacterized membrane protein YqhA
MTLLIFTISLYELFLGEIDAPDWMIAHSLVDLKTPLSSMMVLIMAIKFLHQLLAQPGGVDQDPWRLQVQQMYADLRKRN